jgi:hypothetical protein
MTQSVSLGQIVTQDAGYDEPGQMVLIGNLRKVVGIFAKALQASSEVTNLK